MNDEKFLHAIGKYRALVSTGCIVPTQFLIYRAVGSSVCSSFGRQADETAGRRARLCVAACCRLLLCVCRASSVCEHDVGDRQLAVGGSNGVGRGEERHSGNERCAHATRAPSSLCHTGRCTSANGT